MDKILMWTGGEPANITPFVESAFHDDLQYALDLGMAAPLPTHDICVCSIVPVRIPLDCGGDFVMGRLNGPLLASYYANAAGNVSDLAQRTIK